MTLSNRAATATALAVSATPPPPHTARRQGETVVDIRLLVDRSIVEVFVMGGRVQPIDAVGIQCRPISAANLCIQSVCSQCLE